MKGETPAVAPGGEIVVYESPDGEVRVDVRLEEETVWLSQRDMATVFRTSTDNVGLHLKNIFSDQELTERATTEDFSVVRTEGRRRVRRQVKHYNLDAIISVGVPRQLQARCAVSAVGDAHPARAPSARLHRERAEGWPSVVWKRRGRLSTCSRGRFRARLW